MILSIYYYYYYQLIVGFDEWFLEFGLLFTMSSMYMVAFNVMDILSLLFKKYEVRHSSELFGLGQLLRRHHFLFLAKLST
jgi:hypothetical protein